MDKSKVTSSFRGISCGLWFLAPFLFSLSLLIGKRSTLVKINPTPSGFYGSVYSLTCYSCFQIGVIL